MSNDDHSQTSQGAGSPSGGGSWSTILTVLVAVVLLVIVGGATVAVLRVPGNVATVPLPELPDLEKQPASLAKHLRDADALARSEGDADAIGALAMAYHADDFSRHAQECYEAAQKLDPSNWRWKYYAALLHEEFGNTASAIEMLQGVVEENPKLTSAWLRLGRGRFKLNQFAAAETAFRKVIEIENPPPVGKSPAGGSTPLYVHALYELARVAEKQEQWDVAKKVLIEVVQRREDYGPAQRLLDQVLEELGESRPEELVGRQSDSLPVYIPPHDPLVDALVGESHNSTFLMKQVDVAIRTRRHNWAEHLCQQAVRVNESDPDAVGMLASILLNRGQFDEAAPHVQSYLEIGGPEYVMLAMIGKAMIVGNRAKMAEQIYRDVLQSNPRNATAHVLLSYLLTNRGEHREAIKHCQQAIDIEPQLPFAHVNWGNALMALGEIDEAIAHFEAALKIQPNQGSAQAGLGRALFMKGKTEMAVKHLSSAHLRAPGDVRLLVDLIYALVQAEKLDRAAGLVKTAVKSVGRNVAQLNRLAWLLSTSPHAEIRDGATAVRLAKAACELTRFKNPICLDTLAVAYAEVGRFDAAVKMAQQAESLIGAKSGPLRTRIGEHLELFRAGRPYRSSPAPAASGVTPSN